MDRVNKVKKWVEKQLKNKKFVIITIVFLVLLVAVVFGLTISFSGILGSAYDVDSIGKNIDKIKIGDTINYTANGYSDWEVLNINKGDNTIEIVSRTSVENVTISGYEGFTNYYDILQATANKYMDGKYAISARSITQDDLTRLEARDFFWIPRKVDNKIFYNDGSVSYEKAAYFHIIPVVSIHIPDASGIKAGDSYGYSYNGVEEWVVLQVHSSVAFDIIPKTPIKVDLYPNDRCVDAASYINSEIEKFRDPNVVDVRSIDSNDISSLNSMGYGLNDNYNYIISFNNSPTKFYEEIVEEYYGSYTYKAYDYSTILNTSIWNESNTSCRVEAYTTGFRPVVTIKYSDEEKNKKEVTEKLNIGDYVKYSANAYNNWRVLSIDRGKNTVDIISAGIVKNITLEAKEDYDNLESILQEEVDKYKVGDNVISARAVDTSDFDNLKAMKDTLTIKFFLNNKKKYRINGINDSYNSDMQMVLGYGVGVGYYDMSSLQIKYDWAVLEYVPSPEIYGMSVVELLGSHRYTAGLRPIITLKLSEVEESEDKEVVDNNSSLAEEQNKANQSTQGLVSNEKIEKEEIKDTNKEDTSDDPVGSIEDETNKTTKEFRSLSESLESVEDKTKQLTTAVIINLILTVGIGIFSIYNKFSK